VVSVLSSLRPVANGYNQGEAGTGEIDRHPPIELGGVSAKWLAVMSLVGLRNKPNKTMTQPSADSLSTEPKQR
jgi:hypothetical protein